jgi:CheY-like chemotaxis protein
MKDAETILLVEDEEEVRAVAREMLEAKGYRVLAAADPEEAERLAGAHPERIDLLLTDVVMPGMNGPALAERLRPVRRDMRVVYMSGYTAEVIGDYGVLAPGVPFVPKPFTLDGLNGKIREVLDRRSPFARPGGAPPASGPSPSPFGRVPLG